MNRVSEIRAKEVDQMWPNRFSQVCASAVRTGASSAPHDAQHPEPNLRAFLVIN